MSINRWTIMIKSLRLASEYSLGEAAKKLNVCKPYLFDVENGNRPQQRN